MMVSGTLPSRKGTGSFGTDFSATGGLVPEVAWALQERDRKGADSSTKDGHLIPVAFSCKDHGADAGALAPTLRSMGFDESHANGGGQVAVAFDTNYITSPDNRSHGKPDGPVHPIPANAHPPAIAFSGRNRGAEPATGMPERPPLTMVEKTGALDATKPWNVAFKSSHFTRGKDGPPIDITPPLSADADKGDQDPLVFQTGVRRLTPAECERLQGFPDGWTEGFADGPRYAMLGNAIAVPCAEFLGRRVKESLA